ncbi:MAG: hypothetical protein LBV12_09205 [Puniceicoccales bacterium]|nr:hypothetical protein [Puniceicoccales bacterium]
MHSDAGGCGCRDGRGTRQLLQQPSAPEGSRHGTGAVRNARGTSILDKGRNMRPASISSNATAWLAVIAVEVMFILVYLYIFLG